MEKIEVVEPKQTLSMKLVQKPIIEYNALDVIAREVARRIEVADLDNIEVNEDNYKEIKGMRTSLSKEFKVFEEKRLLIKDEIIKPYNDFEAKYKNISIVYKRADETLKTKINSVEQNLLDQKVEGLKKYFNETNNLEFIKFEDMELKITRSASDKSLKEQINAYIEQIRVDIAAIKTLDNQERILAKYQISKDLNKSISEVTQEIKLEEEINKTQKRLANKAMTEQKEINECGNIQKEKKHREEPEKIEKKKEKFVSSFTVYAETLEELKGLKNYMERAGLRYEQFN